MIFGNMRTIITEFQYEARHYHFLTKYFNSRNTERKSSLKRQTIFAYLEIVNQCAKVPAVSLKHY